MREFLGDQPDRGRVAGAGEGAGVVHGQGQHAPGAGEVALDPVAVGVLDPEADVGVEGGPVDDLGVRGAVDRLVVDVDLRCGCRGHGVLRGRENLNAVLRSVFNHDPGGPATPHMEG